MDILKITEKYKNDDGDLKKSIIQTRIELAELPYDIEISTATVTCKVGNSDFNFNVENIGLYFNEFDDKLIGMIFGNRIVSNLVTIKQTFIDKKEKKEKKNKKKNFYNQVTFIFRSSALLNSNTTFMSEKEKNKTVNVKLFLNGSVQMTGCKHIDNVYHSLMVLFQKLHKRLAILNDNFEFVEKPFVNDKTQLKPECVSKFCIQMINTNFSTNFNINRAKLFELLLEAGYEVNYDPIIHAGGVSLKYNLKSNPKKIISLFIFESGSITIAGCNSPREINETYYFINKFILTN